MRSEVWSEFKEVDGIPYRLSRIRTIHATKKISYSTRLQAGDRSCPVKEPSRPEHAAWCLDKWIQEFQKYYKKFSEEEMVIKPTSTGTPEELAKYIYTKDKT